MVNRTTVVFAPTVAAGRDYAAEHDISRELIVTPRNFRKALRGVERCEDLVAVGISLGEVTPQIARHIRFPFIHARTGRGAEVYRWLWERATTVE